MSLITYSHRLNVATRENYACVQNQPNLLSYANTVPSLMTSTTTTTTTSSSAALESAAFLEIPSADECKAFIQDRTAVIFWQFKRTAIPAVSQKKYEPIELFLLYELTDDEQQRVKDKFNLKGWDVKFSLNDIDKDANYKTKICVFFSA